MRWQKKNQNQNKTNKQNPKSSPIVLQEAWVSQAYCVTTDFQTLVNLPNSKTENKNQTAVENIKCEKTKHQIRGKNSMKSFITHLPLLVIFCIFGLHYKLPSVLHILCKAYLVWREETHQPCDPFLQNTLHPFQTCLGGPAGLLIPKEFLTKHPW